MHFVFPVMAGKGGCYLSHLPKSATVVGISLDQSQCSIYIIYYVTGSAKTPMFTSKFWPISKCCDFYIIWDSIVEISVSVQKFLCFILVQRNHKSVALSGLYSCFVKMYKYANMEGFRRAGHIYCQ